ncbi:HesA/MoeB/ThiF family protein [Sphingobacterium kitahiroshimense]|uniref:HesA/MoeB/ThiF family protein n=1 Tax=Sphingobacterium kitahiroshimense TaxID=470446 RepID=UPI003208332E
MHWDPRYERHYSLPGFGYEAQEKLTAAQVLVVGAGGLGCPVLQYLTAAGVGRIGIVDFDTIELSNLQRQTLYSTADLGQLKCAVAVRKLSENNPSITIVGHPVLLDDSNGNAIVSQYDIVVDCTDNFAARYVINDCCTRLKKPLVFAAIYQYEGQIAIFNVADDDGTVCHYRDLFPQVPSAEEAPNCSENGVLGVLPGIIGLMQATEVLKLITGIGVPLVNKLMTFNVLTYQSIILSITPNPQSTDGYTVQTSTDTPQNQHLEQDISLIYPNEIASYLQDKNVSLVDIRESYEEPSFAIATQEIPLSILFDHLDELKATHIIVVCQSGKRSLHAAGKLKAHFGSAKRVSHLAGGIISYLSINKAE